MQNWTMYDTQGFQLNPWYLVTIQCTTMVQYMTIVYNASLSKYICVVYIRAPPLTRFNLLAK